ncbi:MAG: hypothetical protein ACJAQ3_003568 [Planctomycetota bacterium]|jgi:uncharacterized protein (TIGR02722 family)
MKTLLLSGLVALGAGFSSACNSADYGDPNKVETLTIDFGSTDLQTFADTMSASLLENPNLNYLEAPGKREDKRIIAVFGGIANETREHINTDQISRKILANLQNSGKFRFLAREESNGQDEIAEEIRFQNSGKVREDMAKAGNNQLGADVRIYGNLSDIYKEKGRSIASLGSKKKDLFYQFFMSAVNLDTGEILWSQEVPIRKTESVSLFGRG